ncbi:MAG: hypothetical protein GY721_01470 [Deltaproteobacteria bacterium]|nr:hypothetical protein [Deltaproteobacteria bacterium]
MNKNYLIPVIADYFLRCQDVVFTHLQEPVGIIPTEPLTPPTQQLFLTSFNTDSLQGLYDSLRRSNLCFPHFVRTLQASLRDEGGLEPSIRFLAALSFTLRSKDGIPLAVEMSLHPAFPPPSLPGKKYISSFTPILEDYKTQMKKPEDYGLDELAYAMSFPELWFLPVYLRQNFLFHKTFEHLEKLSNTPYSPACDKP